MYMKMGLLALVISAIYINHYTPPVNVSVPAKPIALIKYNDIVYQCQGVVTTECGYSIHCGNLSVHCLDTLTIQYL